MYIKVINKLSNAFAMYTITYTVIWNKGYQSNVDFQAIFLSLSWILSA